MSPHERRQRNVLAVLSFVFGIWIGLVIMYIALASSHRVCRTECVELGDDIPVLK